MLVKQLSIFLENKSGRLTEVTEVLGEAGINLSAMSIADNSDFGTLRCVVSDPDRAYDILKKAGFAVKVTDIIAFAFPNAPGALSTIFRFLSEHGVFIEYMYSFNNGDGANAIIRPTDLEACDELLQKANVKVLGPEELYNL